MSWDGQEWWKERRQEILPRSSSFCFCSVASACRSERNLNSLGAKRRATYDIRANVKRTKEPGAWSLNNSLPKASEITLDPNERFTSPVVYNEKTFDSEITQLKHFQTVPKSMSYISSRGSRHSSSSTPSAAKWPLAHLTATQLTSICYSLRERPQAVKLVSRHHFMDALSLSKRHPMHRQVQVGKTNGTVNAIE